MEYLLNLLGKSALIGETSVFLPMIASVHHR